MFTPFFVACHLPIDRLIPILFAVSQCRLIIPRISPVSICARAGMTTVKNSGLLPFFLLASSVFDRLQHLFQSLPHVRSNREPGTSSGAAAADGGSSATVVQSTRRRRRHSAAAAANAAAGSDGHPQPSPAPQSRILAALCSSHQCSAVLVFALARLGSRRIGLTGH